MNQIIRLFLHPLARSVRIVQFLLALAIYFYAALMPTNETPATLPAWLLHFIGNVLLILSAWTALFYWWRFRHIAIACISLALLAELAQGATATRIVDPLDLVSNAAGLMAGGSLCFVLEKAFRKRVPPHLRAT